jgi:hypothetical protein
MGVVAGQTISIINSDPTTHNIHPTPKDNREWNESQPPKAAPLEKNFAREEVMLPVKCNQHPWMRIRQRLKSPSPSPTDGKYEIKGLPPAITSRSFTRNSASKRRRSLWPPRTAKRWMQRSSPDRANLSCRDARRGGRPHKRIAVGH